ncbi:serine/threonine protein kinase [Elusimicrobiota bacterium]
MSDVEARKGPVPTELETARLEELEGLRSAIQARRNDLKANLERIDGMRRTCAQRKGLACSVGEWGGLLRESETILLYELGDRTDGLRDRLEHFRDEQRNQRAKSLPETERLLRYVSEIDSFIRATKRDGASRREAYNHARKQHRIWWIVGVVLVLLAAAIAVVASYRRLGGISWAWAEELLGGSPKAGDGPIGGIYERKGRLGGGGTGAVFKAEVVQKLVALKQMYESMSQDPQKIKDFLEEASIITGLDHENIVKVHTTLRDGDRFYLVLEFVDGTSLADWLGLPARPLHWKHARRIVEEVGKALDHAHAKHIIHCDLSPDNILVRRKDGGEIEWVKIIDFGIAQCLDKADLLPSGVLPGKKDYMAPEQMHGGACKASDIYALAICCYEILTGELPFGGKDDRELAENKSNGEYRLLRDRSPIKGLSPDVIAKLDAVLKKALSPSPDNRHQEATDLVREVKDALGK